jgi:DNA-directed RNA polymerase
VTLNLNIIDFTDEQLRRELEHEQDMIDTGIATVRNRQEGERDRGNAGALAGGRVLMSRMSGTLAERIIEEIARLEDGRVKRKPPELRTLKLLPAKDAAVLAIRSVTNVLAQYKNDLCTTQRLGFCIGNEIEGEYLARLFRKNDRGLFDRVIRNVNERSKNPEQRRKEIVEAYERISDDDAARLTNTDKVRLGTFLLAQIEDMGVVSSSTIVKGKKASKVFELTETAMNIMTKADEMAAEMQPHLYPTLIQPRPWTTLRSGGYWLPFKRGGQMVVARTKTNGIRKATEEEMPHMFRPVNYLQNTPFRVNSKVLAVVERMRETGITCGSLPKMILENVPAKPHDIETNEDARKVWSRAAREVHTRNATAKGKILSVDKTIRLAAGLRNEEHIYFPKVVDFRGRVYDCPSFLKPQGDDLSKGLLEFASGKVVGEDGAYWLAVHGANVWGEDKCSLDERVRWVEANEERIRRTADEPFSDRWWMDADKPFQFLSFCFDWAGFCQNGFDHVSHTPVAMDGSCNGLQHLSAMLRDSVGGAAVNLLPADKPQDIYTQVMTKVVAVLGERAAAGEPTAQKWLPLMKRSVVKRPVMTLPYGATKTGFADQIMEDTIRPLEKEGKSPFKSEPYKAAQYLGKLVWEATGQTVIAARAAMDWLQEVAKIVAKANQPIEWTTPSGFTVKQDYRKAVSRKVELFAAGQRVTLYVAEGHEDKIDCAKMALAIAPNFVHAMDAAHMLRTVELLLDVVGPDVHLSMVHDSYGCHAADAEALAFAIRQAFVQMYQEQDWLEAFREEVAAQLPEEIAQTLPPVPGHGDLNISETLNSLYFFA